MLLLKKKSKITFSVYLEKSIKWYEICLPKKKSVRLFEQASSFFFYSNLELNACVLLYTQNNELIFKMYVFF